jgi:hypothetical protein
MILATSSLFVCLEFIGRHPGLLLVLIGVVGEIACDWKEMEGRLARAKRISAILLVVGLMMEFWEAAKSDNEVADTKERTALVESNNLVLRSNVVALEIKLQPRTITHKQIEDFIFLTEKITNKIPITVHVYSQGDDTMSYGVQIRLMLDKAGFPRPDPNQYQVKTDMGVKIDPDTLLTFMVRKIGVTKEWPMVSFISYGTNDSPFSFDNDIPCERTNGLFRPIVSGENKKKVYEAIQGCFNQIGITTEWNVNDKWASPGEFEIYVPAKIE